MQRRSTLQSQRAHRLMWLDLVGVLVLVPIIVSAVPYTQLPARSFAPFPDKWVLQPPWGLSSFLPVCLDDDVSSDAHCTTGFMQAAVVMHFRLRLSVSCRVPLDASPRTTACQLMHFPVQIFTTS